LENLYLEDRQEMEGKRYDRFLGRWALRVVGGPNQIDQAEGKIFILVALNFLTPSGGIIIIIITTTTVNFKCLL